MLMKFSCFLRNSELQDGILSSLRENVEWECTEAECRTWMLLAVPCPRGVPEGKAVGPRGMEHSASRAEGWETIPAIPAPGQSLPWDVAIINSQPWELWELPTAEGQINMAWEGQCPKPQSAPVPQHPEGLIKSFMGGERTCLGYWVMEK